MLTIKCKGADKKLITKANDIMAGVRHTEWFKVNNGKAQVAKVGNRHRIINNFKTGDYTLVTMEQYNKLIDRL